MILLNTKMAFFVTDTSEEFQRQLQFSSLDKAKNKVLRQIKYDIDLLKFCGGSNYAHVFNKYIIVKNDPDDEHHIIGVYRFDKNTKNFKYKQREYVGDDQNEIKPVQKLNNLQRFDNMTPMENIQQKNIKDY